MSARFIDLDSFKNHFTSWRNHSKVTLYLKGHNEVGSKTPKLASLVRSVGIALVIREKASI